MKAVNTDGLTPSSMLPHSSIVHRDRQQNSTYQQLDSVLQQRHGHMGRREQLQQHLQTQLALHQQSLQQQFRRQYYLKDEIGHLDTVFFAIHLAMSAVHKRVLVTAREQLGFECAMAIFAGALLLRLFFKPLYTRIRPQLVFIVHLLLTIIRASVVYTMASQQSVHARPSMLVANTHTAGVFITTMLAILGGPFRLFEMLGLQQPWQHHVVNTILYMIVHPWAAAAGIRLAFSNVMFYQVHAVHDTVSAVLDALLDAATGMPRGQQHTCSSCAGVVIYGFMCLFASLAVPLYCAWAWEQGAQQRWMQQVAPGSTSSGSGSGDSSDSSTRPAAAAGTPGQPSNGAEPVQQQAAQESRVPPMIHHTRSSGSLGSNSDGSGSGGSSSGVVTRLEAICLRAEAVAAEQESLLGKQLPTLSDVVLHPNFCVRWCAHLSVMFVLALLCWLVANGVALVLLPRLLDSRQLQRWCPNRPYTPYVIAGEVYEGL